MKLYLSVYQPKKLNDAPKTYAYNIPEEKL